MSDDLPKAPPPRRGDDRGFARGYRMREGAGILRPRAPNPNIPRQPQFSGSCVIFGRRMDVAGWLRREEGPRGQQHLFLHFDYPWPFRKWIRALPHVNDGSSYWGRHFLGELPVIKNVERVEYPTSDKRHIEETMLTVVLVEHQPPVDRDATEGGDLFPLLSVYAGFGPPQWVARYGRPYTYAQARAHFPDISERTYWYDPKGGESPHHPPDGKTFRDYSGKRVHT